MDCNPPIQIAEYDIVYAGCVSKKVFLPHRVLRWRPESTDDAEQRERENLPEGRDDPSILPSLIVHIRELEVKLQYTHAHGQ